MEEKEMYSMFVSSISQLSRLEDWIKIQQGDIWFPKTSLDGTQYCRFEKNSRGEPPFSSGNEDIGMSAFNMLFLLNPKNDGLHRLYFFTRILQYMYEYKHAPFCSVNTEELLTIEEAAARMNSEEYDAGLTNIKQRKNGFDKTAIGREGQSLSGPVFCPNRLICNKIIIKYPWVPFHLSEYFGHPVQELLIKKDTRSEDETDKKILFSKMQRAQSFLVSFYETVEVFSRYSSAPEKYSALIQKMLDEEQGIKMTFTDGTPWHFDEEIENPWAEF